jgi:hypothetical protein
VSGLVNNEKIGISERRPWIENEGRRPQAIKAFIKSDRTAVCPLQLPDRGYNRVNFLVVLASRRINQRVNCGRDNASSLQHSHGLAHVGHGAHNPIKPFDKMRDAFSLAATGGPGHSDEALAFHD